MFTFLPLLQWNLETIGDVMLALVCVCVCTCVLFCCILYKNGLPRSLSSKDSLCQCRSHRKSWFNPWVRESLWRKKWQPPPVFLPGKSHGERSLGGYSLWGCKELDMIKHACTLTHAQKCSRYSD